MLIPTSQWRVKTCMRSIQDRIQGIARVSKYNQTLNILNEKLKKSTVSKLPNRFFSPDLSLRNIGPMLIPDFSLFGSSRSTISLFTFWMESRPAKIFGKIVT